MDGEPIISSSLPTLLLVWLALAVGIVAYASAGRRAACALVLAYFFGASLINVPGALAYASSGGANFARLFETIIGFDALLIGLCAFFIGVILADIFPRRERRLRPLALPRPGVTMIVVGIGCYGLLMPVSAFIPSSTSVLSAVASLIVIGFWFYVAEALRRGDTPVFLTRTGLATLLPVGTMVGGGFAGFGTYWLLIILTFVFQLVKRKLLLALLAPVVVFAGLSFAVSYFEHRGVLRDAVWYRNADLGTRLGSVAAMVTEVQPLDLSSPENAEHLVSRLNQNELVGLAIQNHAFGGYELYNGSTVPLWVLIPRAIWPNKPQVGGGGNLVTVTTGVPFMQGTSVGATQTLEFYANFGWTGVIGGFALLGFILRRMDRGLREAFDRTDVRGVLIYGLPGIALLQPGGNLIEIIVAVVASIVAAHGVARGLAFWFRSSGSKASGRQRETTRAPGRHAVDPVQRHTNAAGSPRAKTGGLTVRGRP